MRRQHTHTVVAYRDSSRHFYMALSSLIIVVCLYMYFVSETILSVVMRKEIETHIAEASTEIGVLEAKYIELQHNVSGNIATHHGFVFSDKKIFLYRSDDTLALVKN